MLLLSVTIYCDLLWFIMIYYDLLQFITIYYNLLQFITIYYNLLQFIINYKPNYLLPIGRPSLIPSHCHALKIHSLSNPSTDLPKPHQEWRQTCQSVKTTPQGGGWIASSEGVEFPFFRQRALALWCCSSNSLRRYIGCIWPLMLSIFFSRLCGNSLT